MPDPSSSATRTSPTPFSKHTSNRLTNRPSPPLTSAKSSPSSPPPPPVLSHALYALSESSAWMPPGPAPPCASPSSTSSASRAGAARRLIYPLLGPPPASPSPRNSPPPGTAPSVGSNTPNPKFPKRTSAFAGNYETRLVTRGFYLILAAKSAIALWSTTVAIIACFYATQARAPRARSSWNPRAFVAPLTTFVVVASRISPATMLVRSYWTVGSTSAPRPATTGSARRAESVGSTGASAGEWS